MISGCGIKKLVVEQLRFVVQSVVQSKMQDGDHPEKEGC